MRKQQRSKPQDDPHAASVPVRMTYWLRRVQELIGEHSTEPRLTGEYAGHASTDSLAWVTELAAEIQQDIRKRNKSGGGYDENMALASDLGMVLTTWYACVHRAKSYDNNVLGLLRRNHPTDEAITNAIDVYVALCEDIWGGDEN